MNIREYKVEDLNAIDRIYREHYGDKFSLPDLTHTVTSAVVEKENKVQGFGMVKLWAEGVFIIDHNEALKTKGFASKLLIQRGIDACKHYGIEKLNVSINRKDTNFIAVMQKHFGFREVTDVVLEKEIS